MPRARIVASIIGVILVVATLVMAQTPVGTAFTYQGRLSDSGAPATGPYDLEFKLFDAASAGTQIGGTVALGSVPVGNGVFTVLLDFGGGAFTGSARWLQVGVRPGATNGAYSTILPRQALTPTPHAIDSQRLGGRPASDYALQSEVATTGVPAGAVMHFNLAACPTGWTELTTGRGRYLVGLPSGGALGQTVGAALSNVEDRPAGQHRHWATVYNTPGGATPNGGRIIRGASVDIGAYTASGAAGIGYKEGGTADDTPPGTNAPYIQLLLCQKS